MILLYFIPCLLLLNHVYTTPFSTPGPPDSNSNVVCKVGASRDQCRNWRISVIIILNDNNTRNLLFLQQIQSFLKAITSNCYAGTYIQINTPATYNLTSCPPWEKFSDVIDQNEVGNMNVKNTYASAINTVNANPTDSDAFSMLLDQNSRCQDASDAQTGLLSLIFTGLDYVSLNSTETQFDNYMDRLNYLGYSVKLEIFTDTFTDPYGLLFHQCVYSQDCSVQIYSSTSTISLQDTAPDTSTCPYIHKGWSTTQIVLMATIPSFIVISMIGMVIYIYYRRLVMRYNKWKKFWAEHSRTERGTISNEYVDHTKVVDQWEINHADVDIEDVILGTGAFGLVLRGKCAKDTVPLLKVYPDHDITLHAVDDITVHTAIKRLPAHANEQSRLDLLQEINFMKRIDHHKHVISMLGCVSSRYDPLLLLEYCQHGDLLKFLKKYKQFVLTKDEDLCPIDAEICIKIWDLVSFSLQIADGMAYLASKKVIHRDLAARNILLTADLNVKIGDFGMCRLSNAELYTSKGGRLPIKWMAMESLKYYEYTTKSDVWSYGVVLYEIFSLGLGPYSLVEPVYMLTYLECGNRLPRPEKCPAVIYSTIMENCWLSSPEERPAFSNIVKSLIDILRNYSNEYDDVIKTIEDDSALDYEEIDVMHTLP